ncbi:Beta-glucanase/Beta-glucan synthetase [Nocardioides sp. J9]|uniref:glycoside hydrolase family 16 protein n=1 Tax=unclassified Nocardioides TaxID=2615069 RepID=UPI00048C2827|nr:MULTISPECIES: glycoside hydrolase family 16 protein [unclassified Nocardioides]TWG99437.1 Beta-glucanase/Beta-glucan synthetase [Nocardioides sp. J9]
MRALRCLLALLVAVGLWAGAPSGAEAKRAPAPVLERPATSSKNVVFKGRARARAVVRIQVRTTRWVTVRKVRATRAGRYRVVVPRPARTRAYRAVSGNRTSGVRRVAARPAPRPAPKPTPTPEPAPAPTDACGERPARPGGGHYECSLVEDFTGTELDPTLWLGQNMLGQGDRCVAANPQTVAVADGTLRLSVVPATEAHPCPLRADGTRGTYAAGWISTHGRWSQQYGRFEARMKVQATSLPGLHEAFWLWPDTRFSSDADWPRSGEIDIAETYSVYPDLVVPFLHYEVGEVPQPGVNTAWNCSTTRGEWHTYALEWTADRLEILVDGKTCLVNTSAAATFRKPFIINLSQLLGAGANLPDGRLALPATMEVDWVKVWA